MQLAPFTVCSVREQQLTLMRWKHSVKDLFCEQGTVTLHTVLLSNTSNITQGHKTQEITTQMVVEGSFI